MGLIDQIGLNHLILSLNYSGKSSLSESWQDATPPGHDTNIWTEVLGATGSVDRDATEVGYLKQVFTGPANADTARLHSVHEWPVAPTLWGADMLYKRFVFGWECKFVSVDSIENGGPAAAGFFMGLAPSTVATRATQELIGFVLTANALNSLTDDGGTETLNAVGAPTLTDWHVLAIECYAGGVNFYVDGAVMANHITNIPDGNYYLTWYVPQEAAANGGQLHLGALGCFYEFVVR